MITLSEHAEGVLLPVRAQPGARADAVRGLHQGALKVSVTQAAEKGKANKALIKLLTKKLRLRRSQLTLVSGETSADKKFLVRGLDRDELMARIRATHAMDEPQ